MYFRENKSTDRDAGQMLLATGVVLLLSLLSMAVFSVKVAGITQSSDTSSNGVIQTTSEVIDAIPVLLENRTIVWVDAGVDRLEAAQLSIDSVHDDLLHHGEIRGVEVKILDFIFSDIDGSSMLITGQLGVSDSTTTLQSNVSFIISV
ncbi:MAG: hypothetical protein ISR22_02550 [Candidatus Poseidoniaceae archaeon]|uniref:Uncharacterized protein n=1 Tax=uncultured Poseidoniia archaeon TaxID=1697135 RepID=A0A1B1TF40_9ARCH|nr:hypothetical protein MG2_1559 [uncultured Candidatus Thalassoarchaea sp.]MAU74887.1 hypothetical protein [Euryarchaeota archaeon]MBL6890910.1 hypothetical protein [Candidatus Poseidoniaceae archaeon]RAH07107.1 MAG: hypothetical protein CBC92_002600 [Euryarchaeota archaeon TMED132]|tara:strand:+ start:1455 stop:1898 length:444 start_codon:yes stop_codon:yes gene_type:complete